MDSDTSPGAPQLSATPSATSSANVGSFSLTNIKNVVKQVPVSMALFAAILVFLSVLVFNNKEVYKFTNKNLSGLLGKTMDEEKDCPSQRGVLIHSIVAALVAGLCVYLFHDFALDKLKNLLA
jgi:hypothetical protein